MVSDSERQLLLAAPPWLSARGWGTEENSVSGSLCRRLEGHGCESGRPLQGKGFAAGIPSPITMHPSETRTSL